MNIGNNQEINNEGNKNDFLLCFLSVILVISIPFILYFLSNNKEDEITLVCTMKDEDKIEINYEIIGNFKNNKIEKIDYILYYDVKDVDDSVLSSVILDEKEIGEKYKKEAGVSYSVVNDNGRMALHIYGYNEDVKKFYNEDYADNKNIIKYNIEKKGYTCKEE